MKRLKTYSQVKNTLEEVGVSFKFQVYKQEMLSLM